MKRGDVSVDLGQEKGKPTTTGNRGPTGPAVGAAEPVDTSTIEGGAVMDARTVVGASVADETFSGWLLLLMAIGGVGDADIGPSTVVVVVFVVVSVSMRST